MAIRIALITSLCWILALACLMWGEVRVLRAERDAEIAELKYAEALVHRRTTEVEEFNYALDLHIEALQSSYPRVLKTHQQDISNF